ncbi:MAG TPA: ammonium transporter [Ignavibacteriaceae bacterium]|nr:ammonium transporter [Ignavibacteriaceae bacterium]
MNKIYGQDTLSLEQRISGLEAYIQNGDPANSSLTNVPGPGHNSWMMVSTALVLFMTLPGLALFYGGLVRQKNILSILAQCLGIAGLVTILWWIFGYSFVFGEGGNAFMGNLKHMFLDNVTSSPDSNYSYWVSENIFAMYQMMFAIITPALIIGAIAERMKFSSVLLFVTLWMMIVYFPLAHMVWGIDGFMNGIWNVNAGIKAIDFAGGTVVHMSSGWSALILCIILGKRTGFGKEPMPPHNMVLCMVGTGMLWVGWYGFNAGSAIAADGIAANAFITTTIAASVASFIWPMAEWITRGKPSVLGFCSGVVSGLVVVTPACGFIDINGAIIIGIIAGLIPYIAVWKLKFWLKYDDALDTFGIHGVGGTLGALLTGILATDKVNGNVNKILDGLFIEQIKSIIITLLLSIVATVVIAFLVKALIGLRPSKEDEVTGLDLSEHGEEGYHIV